MSEIIHTCKNCDHRGNGKFCSECGQSFHTTRITFHHILHEVFHTFSHVDKGFFFTLKELIVHPGTMQKRYIQGQRSIYQKPFSTFVLCASATAIGMYLIFQHDVKDEFYKHYFTLFQSVMIPLYALITWLFFRRDHFNYAECLVLLVYSFSMVLLISIFTNLLSLVPNHFNTFFLEIPVFSIYLTFTNLNFFDGENKWIIIIKSVLVLGICDFLSNYFTNLIVSNFGNFIN